MFSKIEKLLYRINHNMLAKERYLRRHFVNKSVAAFEIAKNDKVLEVGSGERWKKVENSMTLNRDDSANADVVADAEKMPLASESFDKILCLEVLEHTPNPQKLINELHRVVQKNGKILLTVPFVFGIHDTEDYYRYTKAGIKLLFNDFNKVEIRENGGFFCVLFHLLRTNLVGTFLYPFLNNTGLILDKVFNRFQKKRVCLGYTVIAQK